jgi:hypothetical protein
MRRFPIVFLMMSALALGEPITREAVEKRLASLEEVRRQTLANLNALNGAVEDCKYWLEQLDKPAAKPGQAEEPKSTPPAGGEAPAKESK